MTIPMIMRSGATFCDAQSSHIPLCSDSDSRLRFLLQQNGKQDVFIVDWAEGREEEWEIRGESGGGREEEEDERMDVGEKEGDYECTRIRIHEEEEEGEKRIRRLTAGEEEDVKQLSSMTRTSSPLRICSVNFVPCCGYTSCS